MVEIVIEFMIEIGIRFFTMAWVLPIFFSIVEQGYIEIAVFII